MAITARTPIHSISEKARCPVLRPRSARSSRPATIGTDTDRLQVCATGLATLRARLVLGLFVVMSDLSRRQRDKVVAEILNVATRVLALIVQQIVLRVVRLISCMVVEV